MGQKVNVKFFIVDPYVGGTGVPRTFLELGKIQKNIFLKIKTTKIKSEKNIYQTIHYTRFFFTVFWIFPDFLKKKYQNSEKITPKLWRFHSQILLNDFGFWDFSIDLRYVGSYGKIPNPSKSSPGGLWKRQNDFLPTCHKGLHDHLRSVMSMHFWRFFTVLNFFEFFGSTGP